MAAAWRRQRSFEGDMRMSTTPAARRKRKGRNIATRLIIALAVIGGAAFAWNKSHTAPDIMAGLLTAKVARGDLIETVSATGSVTAQTGAEVKIGSQITGRIKRLFADVGSEVKAGQVIAELDLPDIQAQLGQAQASLAVAHT